MAQPVKRIYADTSVYGGVYDAEFARTSRRFFAMARRGRFELVVSEAVDDELLPAPPRVRRLYERMLRYARYVRSSDPAIGLRDAYIGAGIVPAKALTDALHVAIATVNHCAVLASWNCAHIVHFQRIPLYNAVNTLRGFPQIAIHTPMEVVGYASENV